MDRLPVFGQAAVGLLLLHIYKKFDLVTVSVWSFFIFTDIKQAKFWFQLALPAVATSNID